MNNEMYHVGVLGMKWGHRKPRTKIARLTNNQTHTHSTLQKPEKKRRVEDLSNSELKAINERMQLERTYKTLTKKDKSAGVKFVSDVLLNAGKQVATAYTAAYMKKGIDLVLTAVAK